MRYEVELDRSIHGLRRSGPNGPVCSLIQPNKIEDQNRIRFAMALVRKGFFFLIFFLAKKKKKKRFFQEVGGELSTIIGTREHSRSLVITLSDYRKISLTHCDRVSIQLDKMTVTEQSVMGVIRAARPTFRNAHDKVAFSVHASFLASGFVLHATGPSAFVNDALTSSSTGTPPAGGLFPLLS